MMLTDIIARLRAAARQMEDGVRLFAAGDNSKDVEALRTAADMLDRLATEALS